MLETAAPDGALAPDGLAAFGLLAGLAEPAWDESADVPPPPPQPASATQTRSKAWRREEGFMMSRAMAEAFSCRFVRVNGNHRL